MPYKFIQMNFSFYLSLSLYMCVLSLAVLAFIRAYRQPRAEFITTGSVGLLRFCATASSRLQQADVKYSAHEKKSFVFLMLIKTLPSLQTTSYHCL